MEAKEKEPNSSPSTPESEKPQGSPGWRPAPHEPEHVGSIWKHPYLIYIYLTAILFVGLVLIAWLAWENGWIPSRTIGTP